MGAECGRREEERIRRVKGGKDGSEEGRGTELVVSSDVGFAC